MLKKINFLKNIEQVSNKKITSSKVSFGQKRDTFVHSDESIKKEGIVNLLSKYNFKILSNKLLDKSYYIFSNGIVKMVQNENGQNSVIVALEGDTVTKGKQFEYSTDEFFSILKQVMEKAGKENVEKLEEYNQLFEKLQSKYNPQSNSTN